MKFQVQRSKVSQEVMDGSVAGSYKYNFYGEPVLKAV